MRSLQPAEASKVSSAPLTRLTRIPWTKVVYTNTHVHNTKRITSVRPNARSAYGIKNTKKPPNANDGITQASPSTWNGAKPRYKDLNLSTTHAKGRTSSMTFALWKLSTFAVSTVAPEKEWTRIRVTMWLQTNGSRFLIIWDDAGGGPGIFLPPFTHWRPRCWLFWFFDHIWSCFTYFHLLLPSPFSYKLSSLSLLICTSQWNMMTQKPSKYMVIMFPLHMTFLIANTFLQYA